MTCSLCGLLVSASASAKNISLMTYNLENLFDTVHDEGKTDYTYMPLKTKKASAEAQKYCNSMKPGKYKEECLTLDWTATVLKKKIMNLAKVIKQADNGTSPDILVMEEVENINALTMLRDIGLSDEGYVEVILLEGPDHRGIDVGMLSKFPILGKPKLHIVDLSRTSDAPEFAGGTTRGILEATFEINGTKLTVLGNHWPSQGNSDEARIAAAKTLYTVGSKIENPVIATGDFNTTEGDTLNGINRYLLNSRLRFNYFDSQREYYGGDLGDDGSYHYDGQWQALDRIFFQKKALGSKVRPLWKTWNIFVKDFMLSNETYTNPETGESETSYNVPMSYNAKDGTGFSDHLPVLIHIEIDSK